ncbi:MAG: KH domain-containing protein [Candidatus Micrarchaeaceae archaeon]
MNKIVIPGEMIYDKPLHIDGVQIIDGKTYSTILAVYNESQKMLIPLEGSWTPRRGETVIGIVEDARLSSYTIDLNSPFKGIVVAKFVSSRLKIGDVIEAKVKEMDETNTAVLIYPRKLFGGKIIDIRPSKVPRVIGKGNTMLNQLIEGTKSNIIVGMNGRIWIKGGNIALATKAILRVEEEAHTSGLTERIKEMLK